MQGSFGVGSTAGRILRVAKKAGDHPREGAGTTNAIGQALIVYRETEDAKRTLREIADSRDKVDEQFKDLIQTSALALDLSREYPLSNELLFSLQAS